MTAAATPSGAPGIDGDRAAAAETAAAPASGSAGTRAATDTVAPSPDAPSAAAALGTLALRVAAVAPRAIGGVVLRGPAGDARRRWLDALQAALPGGTPWRRVPIGIDDDRLLGGLDLGDTLAAGRPIDGTGLLVEADGGVAVLAMAERMAPGTAAHVAAALDTGTVALARRGATATATAQAARIAIVVLDEGEGDEHAPRPLADRAALHLRVEGWPAGAAWTVDAAALAHARTAWRDVEVDAAGIEALVGTAAALGIGSLRPPAFAVTVARVVAALGGRTRAGRDDLEAAAALVLAPRATRLPDTQADAPDAADATNADAPPDGGDTTPRDPPPPAHESEPADATPSDADAPPPPDPARSTPMDDVVVAAAVAAIPPDLLAALSAPLAARRAPPSVGRSGTAAAHAQHGRPLGARRGRPRDGVRLDLLATLRAAAPWQRVRHAHGAARTGRVDGAEATSPDPPAAPDAPSAARPAAPAAARRLRILPTDLHVRRTEARRRTTTVFAVDASGSSALHRLAEAKGAVELLLADCYVRRDSVALVAFRGRTADVLLPPTRSLTRAKRALGELPGGGGTPLAAGLDAAADLAVAATRRGETAVVVVLSDGRGNVARDGTPGRVGGDRDARLAARRLGAQGVATLFVDTSPRPDPAARELAALMQARWLALPHADAAALSRAVRGATGAPAVRETRAGPTHGQPPSRRGG